LDTIPSLTNNSSGISFPDLQSATSLPGKSKGHFCPLVQSSGHRACGQHSSPSLLGALLSRLVLTHLAGHFNHQPSAGQQNGLTYGIRLLNRAGAMVMKLLLQKLP
jgi:hypothetical protein